MIAASGDILGKIGDRSAVVGVIGLGYVGLPLAVEVARSGYRCVGFDVSARVVEGVNRGESHIQDVTSEVLSAVVGEELFSATTDLSRLPECDAISICVPTPLSKKGSGPVLRGRCHTRRGRCAAAGLPAPGPARPPHHRHARHPWSRPHRRTVGGE